MAQLKVFPVMSTPKGAPSFSNDWHMPRGNGRLHEGTDILAAKGTPLLAVDDGALTFGSNTLGGDTAVITVGSTRYYYAHLSGYEGSAPRQVKAGDIIGYVGNSGNAAKSPPHLHFGIYVNGEPINPYPLLVDAPHVMQTKPTVIETVSSAQNSMLKYGLMLAGGFALGYAATWVWRRVQS